MSENNDGNTPDTQSAAQTVTGLQPASSQDISALAAYRAQRQAASSAPVQQSVEGGDTRPDAGEQSQAQPQREPYIPRDRFDEVVNERNQLREQFQRMQQSQAFGVPQQPQQPQYPMQQPQFQPQVGPTGMVQGQQAPQQSQPNAPDFNDPKVQKEWREKIANNPVTGLREFTEHIINSYGAPLVNQAVQSIYQQLQPLQRAFIQQQIQSYSQQRQSDPEFSAAQPIFTNLVQMAQARGIDTTNPQVLGTIEYMAKQQARQMGYVPPQEQQAPPFTERPGNSGATLGKPQTPALTPQQQAMARTFGMSDSEYAQQLRDMGVMR